jgi:ligand-binding SRPBCC domain-containing protein
MMEDIVTYRLPLGPLGDLAHQMFVKSRLESIFAYREQALEHIFPKLEPTSVIR